MSSSSSSGGKSAPTRSGGGNGGAGASAGASATATSTQLSSSATKTTKLSPPHAARAKATAAPAAAATGGAPVPGPALPNNAVHSSHAAQFVAAANMAAAAQGRGQAPPPLPPPPRDLAPQPSMPIQPASCAPIPAAAAPPNLSPPVLLHGPPRSPARRYRLPSPSSVVVPAGGRAWPPRVPWGAPVPSPVAYPHPHPAEAWPPPSIARGHPSPPESHRNKRPRLDDRSTDNWRSLPRVDGPYMGQTPVPAPAPAPATASSVPNDKDSLAIAVEALSTLGQGTQNSTHSPQYTRQHYYDDDRASRSGVPSAAPSATTSPRGHSIMMGPPHGRYRQRMSTAHNVTNVNGAGMYYVTSISMNDVADKAVERDRRTAQARIPTNPRIGPDGVPRDPYTGWPVAVTRDRLPPPETRSSHSGSDAGTGVGNLGTQPTGRSQLRQHLRAAMDGFLFNDNDSFPFSTIWSSDPEVFLHEASSLWSQTDELTDDLNSFTQFFAPKWPGLAGPSLLRSVQNFIEAPFEAKRVTLPDLALFLMVFALGRNGNLESPKLGAFQGYYPPSTSASSGEALAEVDDGANDANSEAARTRSPYFVTDRYLTASYQALRLCSFLSAPTLQTIHAQLLVGLYLRNTDRTASFWPLLGSVTRQAQAIGLHIDPTRVRPQPDPQDATNRRTLWWEIVLQDAQLSAIYGRPLAIAWFTTRITNPPGGSATPPTLPTGGPSTSAAMVSLMPPGHEGPPTTFHEAQCGLAMLMRQRLLDPSQAIDWDAPALAQWTNDGLAWYLTLPPALRLDVTDTTQLQDPSFAVPAWLIQEMSATGGREWSNSSAYRGLKDIQQACDLAMDVFAVLMFTHRGHLLRERSAMMDKLEDKSEVDAKEAWLRSPKAVCTFSIAVMRSALHLMNAHLGHLRSFSMWRTLYLCFHAGVTAAFITLLWPTDPEAHSNLIAISDLCSAVEKAPNRWKQLPKMSHALRVLAQLTFNQVESAKRAKRSPSPVASRGEASGASRSAPAPSQKNSTDHPTVDTLPEVRQRAQSYTLTTVSTTLPPRSNSAGAADVLDLSLPLPGAMIPIPSGSNSGVTPMPLPMSVPDFPLNGMNHLNGDNITAAAVALGDNLELEGYNSNWSHAGTNSNGYEPLERLTRLGALNTNDLSAPDSTQPTSDSVAWWSHLLGFDFASNPTSNPAGHLTDADSSQRGQVPTSRPPEVFPASTATASSAPALAPNDAPQPLPAAPNQRQSGPGQLVSA